MDSVSESPQSRGRIFDALSAVLLVVIVLLIPIVHFPGLSWESIWAAKKLLLVSYVGSRGLYHMRSGWFSLPRSKSLFLFLALIPLYFVNIEPTDWLFFTVFGVTMTIHFMERPRLIYKLVPLFVGWITLNAIYTLLATHTPFPGYNPINTVNGYTTYEEFFGFPIPEGAFGFYHKTYLSNPLAIGTILAIGCAGTFKRYAPYYIGAAFIQLLGIINTIDVSRGHGRASLVVLLFAAVVFVIIRIDMDLIPFGLISPAIGLVFIFVYIRQFGPNQMVITLNEIMSNRIQLYTDTMEIIRSNPFGIGPERWGEVSVYEVGIEPGESVFRHKNDTLTRPHNLILNITVSLGIISGTIFLSAIFYLGQESKRILKERSVSFYWGIATMVLATTFTGLAVGKLGPFTALTNDAIIWWICYAALLAHVSSTADGGEGF